MEPKASPPVYQWTDILQPSRAAWWYLPQTWAQLSHEIHPNAPPQEPQSYTTSPQDHCNPSDNPISNPQIRNCSHSKPPNSTPKPTTHHVFPSNSTSHQKPQLHFHPPSQHCMNPATPTLPAAPENSPAVPESSQISHPYHGPETGPPRYRELNHQMGQSRSAKLDPATRFVVDRSDPPTPIRIGHFAANSEKSCPIWIGFRTSEEAWVARPGGALGSSGALRKSSTMIGGEAGVPGEHGVSGEWYRPWRIKRSRGEIRS